MKKFLFHINANYEEYIEPKSLTGWERSEDDEFYIILCGGQTVAECNWDKIDVDANYFSTKEKAEEIAFKQTLFRKLQRFSDNNGGIEIDWNDYQTNKYSVAYYHSENKIYDTSRQKNASAWNCILCFKRSSRESHRTIP